jgi:hypothetical protein
MRKTRPLELTKENGKGFTPNHAANVGMAGSRTTLLLMVKWDVRIPIPMVP